MSKPTLPMMRAASALTGPIVWAAHFLIIYALESILCRADAGPWHTFVVMVATAIAAAVLVLHAARQLRSLPIEGVNGFLPRAALTLDGLSMLAIALAAAAGLALPACR
ncbi:hypothetical protein [Bosea sp. PAMC 26642]|uniref:hypothetical protein n=1 Tax=Bosea sp. (strain PAMC 26642) TaxID=1792307 RepID=UPI000770296C|nr:hypothetical protein [Bosea sp. PAMC 26642]AMJ62987.1 hypothetical protein AXW83_24200 [Bosea sp. PAMC 26642]